MVSISELFEVKITNNTTEGYLNINKGVNNTNNYSLVKVTATDFNNQAVNNKNLSLSCDKGHFIDINETMTDISWDNVNSIVEQDFSWEIEYPTGTTRTQVILHCDNAHENQEAIIKTSDNQERVYEDINESNIIVLGGRDYSISSVILKPYFDTTTGVLYTGSEYNTFITHTGITDVNGYFEVVYIPTEWGLCTLSCDVVKSQFFVKGFKNMPLSKTPNNPSIFQVDESMRACRLKYTVPAMTVTSSPNILDNGIIPTKYIPFISCRQIHFRGDIGLVITSDSGTVKVNNKDVQYDKGSIIIRSGTTSNPNASSQTALIEWRY